MYAFTHVCYVMWSCQGSEGLEINTYMSELPEDLSIAELSDVIAIKEIIKDGYKVRASSLSVQIQDNSLRTG